MTCPELVSNYSNPAIKWYQTDLKVVVSIQLPDVFDYYIRVENDCLQFSTETNGKQYYLILYLFGAVIAEKTVQKNIGREIKIYFTKALKWFPWLRLTKSKERNPLISHDSDHIEDPTVVNYPNRNNLGNFGRYKREHNLNIMPVVPSSDEDESEDDQFIDDVFRYG